MYIWTWNEGARLWVRYTGIVNNSVYQNYLEHTSWIFTRKQCKFRTVALTGIDAVVARNDGF